MADATADLAKNRYHDGHFKSDAVKLLPGEYYVSCERIVLTTVLGSCVAACIRDPRTGIGGMNHFMLPDVSASREGVASLSSSARYGAYAMEVLINELIKLGAARNRLEAKVFGGGNVLKGFASSNVGERNATFVTDFLRTERIPVLARDLGGMMPRKIYYFPHIGKVMVKTLRTLHNDTIFERELDYRSRLRRSKIAGEVELFG